MIAAFTALLAAFSYQNDLIDTQRTVADLEVAKSRESFVVTTDSEPCTDQPTSPNDECLVVTVNNRGTNAVEIAKLWVIEKVNGNGDANSYEADQYDTKSDPALNFNDLIAPVATSKDITSDLIPVNSQDADGYTIKVVSKLGTIVAADYPQVGNGPPGPPGPPGAAGQTGINCWDTNPQNGQNDPAEDVYPPPSGDGIFNALDCQGQSGGPQGNPGINCWDTDGDGFNDPSEDIAVPFGTWNALDCQGPEGDQGPPGNAETIELGLLNKPEIFMIFPSPFGEFRTSNPGPNYGAWGVTIANPSENAMAVNKIVISTIPTTTISGQTVFNTCPPGRWTCTGNQMVWNAPSGGDTINAKSAKSYIVSPSPSANNDQILNGFPVFASVLTDYGQFGKTNYLSSMISPTGNTNEEPIVNVYRSDTKDSLSDIKGTWTFESGQQLTSYFTISDNSTANTNAYVESATNLIINVPKTFTVDGSNGYTSFTIQPIVPNSDTSTQVIATLTENVGGGAGSTSNARSIQLTITAPIVPTGQQPKLYVMYILAEGLARSPSQNSDWQIGPIDEVVIRVNPSP